MWGCEEISMKVPIDYAIYISFYILYWWQMSLYSQSSPEELLKLIWESNQKCQYDKSTKRNEKNVSAYGVRVCIAVFIDRDESCIFQ